MTGDHTDDSQGGAQSDARRTNSKGRWRALVLLALTLVLAMSPWFSASAVLPQLNAIWDISASQAAWMTIAVQVGFVVGALISSLINLADLVRPRHVILGGAVGAALSNVLLDQVAGPAAGIPLRFATGFFLAGVYPPAFKLMSTWFRSGRGMALGVLAGAIVLGNGSPHLVNGLGGLDWQLVLYTTSSLTVVGGLIAEFLVKEGPYPFPEAVFEPRQALRALGNRGVRLASLGYVGHMWELFAMYAWFSAFYAAALAAHGIEVGANVAYATFAIFCAGGLGCWAGGVLADRLGRTRTTAWLMSVSGACALLIGFLLAAPMWMILALGLVWGFAVVADSAQFSTMVTELADPAYVGTALTLQLAAGYTITVATIWLIPYLAQSIGWRWTFAFLAPGPALGVLAMLRLRGLPEAERIAGGLG
ncbi:MAG: MFS transporter [Anaerolineales bacterium]